MLKQKDKKQQLRRKKDEIKCLNITEQMKFLKEKQKGSARTK